MNTTLSRLARSAACGALLQFLVPLNAFPLEAVQHAAPQGPKQAAGVVETSGRIWPRKRFTVQLRPGEALREMVVHEGERVRRGQLLLRLTNDTLLDSYANLQRARAERELEYQKEQDRARLLEMKLTDLRRRLQDIRGKEEKLKALEHSLPAALFQDTLRPLREKEVELSDEAELQEAELAMLKARLPLFAAPQLTHRLDLLDRDLEKLDVRAPFSGKVVRCTPASEIVPSGESVLTLWGDGGYEVEAMLRQQQLDKVRPGCRVKVFVDYFKSDFVWGVVREVSAPQDKGGREAFPTFPVIVDVPKAGNVAPGAAVALQILLCQPGTAP